MPTTVTIIIATRTVHKVIIRIFFRIIPFWRQIAIAIQKDTAEVMASDPI